MSDITDREREILQMTATGNSAKEIAQQLGISHRTVEEHRKTATQKLDGRNIVDACCKAIKASVIRC